MEVECQDKERSRLSKALWITAGTIFLGFAVIGIILPLIPYTPFLLLAAACYCRGSKKIHSWLLNHRVFGGYIRDWEEHRGIKMRAKVISIVMLWVTITISALFFVDFFFLQLALFGVAVCVTLFLLSLKTVG